ncbi:MAG TPA: hypothetical protein PLY73_14730 [Candidatus Ozemobacteraceae bacterium]|nr:hypothetical protein [Candidatus Ozemobacteraceae bacterium]
MRSISRYCISIGIFSLLCGIVPASFGQEGIDWKSRLAGIQDASLKRTLENSIAAGLIVDDADFETAVARAETRFRSQNPTSCSSVRAGGNTEAIRDAIAKAAAPIPALDRDAVDVKKNEGLRTNLFKPITDKVPASYETAYRLAVQFDPRVGTDDSTRLGKEIDAYLASIANDPVIKQALSSTGTTLSDLKRNWFGSGAGFEHVICGEIKGTGVSGYHWWYKFYRDEQNGIAKYVSTLDNAGSEFAYTGAFTWDPDGSGPLPNAKKKKGGFTVGCSAQALLALGHIAIESARKFGSVPGALTFDAAVNGRTFTWQLYTMGGTIRSLYPMGGKGFEADENRVAEEYFELEQEALQAVNSAGSLTVH